MRINAVYKQFKREKKIHNKIEILKRSIAFPIILMMMVKRKHLFSMWNMPFGYCCFCVVFNLCLSTTGKTTGCNLSSTFLSYSFPCFSLCFNACELWEPKKVEPPSHQLVYQKTPMYTATMLNTHIANCLAFTRE